MVLPPKSKEKIFEELLPDLPPEFKKLADTGHVEFLAETYSHSLVSSTFFLAPENIRDNG